MQSGKVFLTKHFVSVSNFAFMPLIRPGRPTKLVRLFDIHLITPALKGHSPRPLSLEVSWLSTVSNFMGVWQIYLLQSVIISGHSWTYLFGAYNIACCKHGSNGETWLVHLWSDWIFCIPLKELHPFFKLQFTWGILFSICFLLI